MIPEVAERVLDLPRGATLEASKHGALAACYLCFRRENLAHRLAKPGVPRVRGEPRVPDHQKMKWTQLLRRFHEAQGGIPLHHLPHAIGQSEDEFRARKATKGRAKIWHANSGASL